MRWIIAGIVFGMSVLSASTAHLDVSHAAARGTLHLRADVSPFEVRPSEPAPDVLYPTGRMLARLADDAGASVTISFDESHCLTEAERRAFQEVAEEEAQKGSSHHAVRRHQGRDWIYQVFAAPGDSVLTAQTFVHGHPLAVVFWLPRDGTPPLEDGRVPGFLDQLAIQWLPFSPEEGGAGNEN